MASAADAAQALVNATNDILDLVNYKRELENQILSAQIERDRQVTEAQKKFYNDQIDDMQKAIEILNDVIERSEEIAKKKEDKKVLIFGFAGLFMVGLLSLTYIFTRK